MTRNTSLRSAYSVKQESHMFWLTLTPPAEFPRGKPAGVNLLQQLLLSNLHVLKRET